MTRAQHVWAANKMYEVYFLYYEKHGVMPDEEAALAILQKLFLVVHGWAPRTSFAEFEKICSKRSQEYEARIRRDMANGVTSESFKKKPNKTPEEKLAAKEKKNAERQRRRAKKRAQAAAECLLFEQDDQFAYIAGYTSNGIPYGVTWEEAEGESCEDL